MVTVLDRSSSMGYASTIVDGQTRWERTAEALNVVIDGIGDGGSDPTPWDVFGLVTFGTRTTDDANILPPIADTASFKATVSGFPNPGSSSYTNTDAALQAAAAAVCPANSFKLLLLASDGAPTAYGTGGSPTTCSTSPTGWDNCLNAAVAAGEAAKAAGWYIISLGLNLDPNVAVEQLGLNVLDSIATTTAFNIPTPAEGTAVVAALVSLLDDITISNVALADTLNDCWSYVPGSTSASQGGAADPLLQPFVQAVGDSVVLNYSIPTIGTNDSVVRCYNMEYDVATCGTVPSSIAFNSGAVTYDTGTGPGEEAIPGSEALDMASCTSILPVELVEFTAISEQRDVSLKWSTASELNNAGFEVEHAFADGFFEMAGFVSGSGSTYTPREYAYDIKNLEPGMHRFRLKQVDFDGAFEYSETLEVAVEAPGQYFLSEAYPNPFNPQASIRFWVTRSQPVEVALHDIQGRQLRTLYEGVPASKSSTLVRIDGSDLSSGTYLVRIQGEDFMDSRQVVLLK